MISLENMVAQTGGTRVNGPLKAANHRGQFLSAWFRNPLRTGALWPSGPWLAQAMAAQVDPARAGSVVELGAGTGAMTRALVARGVTQERLVLVEKHPALVDLLKQQFPQATVLHADAAFLEMLLAGAGAEPPGTVVSSLPLLSMRKPMRIRVLSQVFGVLAPGGTLVQFTYSPLPPIPATLEASLWVRGTRVGGVSWNLPPAAVWVYSRRSGNKARNMRCAGERP